MAGRHDRRPGRDYEMDAPLVGLIARYAILAGLLSLAMPGRAQEQVISIWPGDAPGSEKWTRKEVTFVGFGNQQMVRNVVRPTLTAFLPKQGAGNEIGRASCRERV